MSRSEVDLIDEVEEGERWLRQFDTPLPSAAAMARVKQEILREMHGGAAASHSPASHWHWRPWHGVLASAASIALAVLVGSSQMPVRTQNNAASNRVPVATASSDANLSTYTTMDSELSELESTNLERGSLVDAWDEIWTMTDGQIGKRPG
jgi:hypothetical protein